jgi:hypothetical protein
MSGAHNKPKGASLHTLLVYEDGEVFKQYAGAGKLPVAVFDRERSVLEAARRIAAASGLDSIRVVFIVEPTPNGPTTPPPPGVRKS